MQVLLYAQLRDNTNNMVKVVTNDLKRDPGARAPHVERETKVSALINGGRTAGIVVMSQAMTVLLEKSRQNGVGIVGTNHTCTGSGAIGWVGWGDVQAANDAQLVLPFITSSLPAGLLSPQADRKLTGSTRVLHRLHVLRERHSQCEGVT